MNPRPAADAIMEVLGDQAGRLYLHMREIARQAQVSRETTRRVVRQLAAEGRIETGTPALIGNDARHTGTVGYRLKAEPAWQCEAYPPGTPGRLWCYFADPGTRNCATRDECSRSVAAARSLLAASRPGTQPAGRLAATLAELEQVGAAAGVAEIATRRLRRVLAGNNLDEDFPALAAHAITAGGRPGIDTAARRACYALAGALLAAELDRPACAAAVAVECEDRAGCARRRAEGGQP